MLDHAGLAGRQTIPYSTDASGETKFPPIDSPRGRSLPRLVRWIRRPMVRRTRPGALPGQKRQRTSKEPGWRGKTGLPSRWELRRSTSRPTS